MSEITIQGISKTFGDTRVLNDISFCAKDGNLLSLLGPSGCGKTTLLRIIAGLEYADSGTIHVGERDLTPIPVEKRNIGVVFQNYALIPHMTVFNNIAYGLKIRKVPKEQIREKVEQYIRLVGLTGMTDRKVTQLSGGQQQRVALARALIIEPDILLLDEPLSALDRKIRAEMQYEIRRIQQQVGITTIFVTHDQEEAMTMSDEILLMRNGGIEQLSTPENIYNHPVSLYASDFLGKANTLIGTLHQASDGWTVFGDGWEFPVEPQNRLCRRGGGLPGDPGRTDPHSRCRGGRCDGGGDHRYRVYRRNLPHYRPRGRGDAFSCVHQRAGGALPPRSDGLRSRRPIQNALLQKITLPEDMYYDNAGTRLEHLAPRFLLPSGKPPRRSFDRPGRFL